MRHIIQYKGRNATEWSRQTLYLDRVIDLQRRQLPDDIGEYVAHAQVQFLNACNNAYEYRLVTNELRVQKTFDFDHEDGWF